MQDLAYRRLLDMYYDTSKPLISDVKKLSRLLGMSEFQPDVEVILDDFFELSELGYSQKRVDEELACYQQKADKARVNGKKGGRPPKADSKLEETQSVDLSNQEETELKAKHKPLTIKHKPLTINQELVIKDTGAKAKRFMPPTLDHVLTYCNERLNNVDANKFIDHYTSNGWLVGKNKMKDWKAAVRTWEKSSFDKPSSNQPASRPVSTTRFF